jgi:endoglucanase Acf2
MDVVNYNNNYTVTTPQHWVMYADPPLQWREQQQEQDNESFSSSSWGQKWIADRTESYTGTIRMAKLPVVASSILVAVAVTQDQEHSSDTTTITSSTNDDFDPIYNLYDPYRDCIVNGGTIHIPIAESHDAATTTTDDDHLQYFIQWRTISTCPNGILHFGLPHHASMIQLYSTNTTNNSSKSSSSSDTARYDNLVLESTTRGIMSAYVSLSGIWRFHVGRNSLPSFPNNNNNSTAVTKDDIDRNATNTTSSGTANTTTHNRPIDDVRGVFLPRTILSTIEQMESIHLVSTLYQEIVVEPWTIPLDGSYYFNGKAMQKYATLCLLANQTVAISSASNVSSSSSSTTNYTFSVMLLDHCMNKLGSILDTTFIDNNWTFPLVYDEIYGGVVSSQGYTDENSTLADFGNTVYNDHHYHWGYWIVTSAIYVQLNQYLNSTTYNNHDRMDRLINIVNVLIRDAVNPSPNEAYFPMYRHFNWFYGHSLSRGIIPSIDGKDQESVSEEMNFHYGVYLWGYVTQNRVLERLGQLLLNVNAHTIQTYFLFTNDNTVHPIPIRSNKVAGILFDSKILYDTWFCSLPECIHGIQMLPVSPITPMYRSKQFIQEEWDEILSTIPVYQDNPTSSWISLIYVNLAHVDPAMAVSKLSNDVDNYDNGLSRSWAMYYAATYGIDEEL